MSPTMNGFSSNLTSWSAPPSDSADGPDLPSPPWVEVQGIDNFRDIGGYPIAGSPSRSVRRTFCYRCADPARLTDAGRTTITALGITDVFDLRSALEGEKNTAALRAGSAAATHRGSAPFANLHGVSHHFTPVFEEMDFSPAAMANYTRGGTEGFTAAYRHILENAGPALIAMLTHVRDRPDAPFLLHCSAGKDRTGMLVAVMMKLVGCSDGVVAREYELTERGLAPMREIIMAHLKKQPGLDTDDAGLRRMVSARGENMLAALAMLQQEYGGAEAYVKQACGFTDEDIAVMKRNLTADTPPIF